MVLPLSPFGVLLAIWALIFASSAAADSEKLNERDAVPAGYNALPYYPAPNGGWASQWQQSYAKAQALVANMTLAEKTNITSGTGQYMGRCVGVTGSASIHGFPQLCLQDGPL
jgi:beta-glucosidase